MIEELVAEILKKAYATKSVQKREAYRTVLKMINEKWGREISEFKLNELIDEVSQ